MSSSLVLTNCLFCIFAALLLLPTLKNPNILTYKKGIPIFIAIILILIKLLIPYEFSFTQTLASKRVLPAIKAIGNFPLIANVTVGEVLLYIWLFIAVLLLVCVISRHRKTIRILHIVPETNNQEITLMLSEFCTLKQIKHKPKIIQLDIDAGSFIIGLRNPILVLPCIELTKDELKFILLHELEHLKHGHLLIKVCAEIVTVIYWWNPIVWLLRWEVINALEIQADTYVMRELSNQESLSYLDVLLQFCRRKHLKYESAMFLSYSLRSNMVESRIKTALKYDCFHKKIKTPKLYVLLLILSTMLLLSSFFYTFESYKINTIDVKGTFTVNSKTDYLVLREDGDYDLYIAGEYIITMSSIPNDLSNLSVYK